MARLPTTNDDTGKVELQALDAARDLAVGTPDSADAAEQRFLSAALELAERRSNGNGNSPADFKRFGRKNALLTTLLALIVGGAGVFAGYKVLQADVARHEKEIVDHAAKPMHDAAASEFQDVKAQVGAVETKLGEVQTSQQEVVTGLKELKQENVDRLKKERDDLARELRRERRRNQ